MSDQVKLNTDCEVSCDNLLDFFNDKNGAYKIDTSGNNNSEDSEVIGCAADYKVSEVLGQSDACTKNKKEVQPCDKIIISLIEPCSDISKNKEKIHLTSTAMSNPTTVSTTCSDSFYSSPEHVETHKLVCDEKTVLHQYDCELMPCGALCELPEIVDHSNSCLDCANEIKLNGENSSSLIEPHSNVLLKKESPHTVDVSRPQCSFNLPDFNQLCGDDEDDEEEEFACDGLTFSCASNCNDQFLLPKLPKFESNSIGTINNLSNSDTSSLGAVGLIPKPGKSLTELVKDIQRDLTIDEDCDLGLEGLFEEKAIEANNASQNSKSKSAKKRKKQQMKLRKLLAPNTLDKKKPKFAQTFDELKKSTLYLDDIDADSSLTCSVCLELYHLPNICQPCGHMFCDLCLRRLTHQGIEGIPCPLCRTIISYCQLDKEFDENLLMFYPEIYKARAMSDRHSKYRHHKLPYTPKPCKKKPNKRVRVQQGEQRNNQPNQRWMAHDSFKFFIGCTVAMFVGSLFMLLNRLRTGNNRDLNIVPLSVLLGSTVSYFAFKLGQRMDGRHL